MTQMDSVLGSRLRGRHKVVMLVLIQMMDQSGIARFRAEDLASRTGVENVSQIYRELRGLRESGLIEPLFIRRGPGGGSAYLIKEIADGAHEE